MKKQKQTRERPIRGRSVTSSHNKNNKIPVSSVFLTRIIVMIFNIAKDCTERLSAVRGSEKNRESNVTDCQCLLATCFTNSDISASCFTSIPSTRPPEIANINPQQENQIFTMENIVPANISSTGVLFSDPQDKTLTKTSCHAES